MVPTNAEIFLSQQENELQRTQNQELLILILLFFCFTLGLLRNRDRISSSRRASRSKGKIGFRCPVSGESEVFFIFLLFKNALSGRARKKLEIIRVWSFLKWSYSVARSLHAIFSAFCRWKMMFAFEDQCLSDFLGARSSNILCTLPVHL